MWKHYHIVETSEQLAELLATQEGPTKIIAGGTDLMVEINNEKWQNLDTVLDISRVVALDKIWQDKENNLHIGAIVTHNDVLHSRLLRDAAFPLVQACYTVASPALRNRATVVGNLVTASPANDTIPTLMALDAKLVLASVRGERIVPLSEFYKGYRQTALEKDEYVKEVFFKGLTANQRGSFRKQGLRKAQAISILNCCVLLSFEEDVISDAKVTMGSVGPVVMHAPSAEAFLIGKVLDDAVIDEASRIAASDAKAISDIRGSKEFRDYMMKELVFEALHDITRDDLRQSIPRKPISLNTKDDWSGVKQGEWDGDTIRTTVNGEEYILTGASKMSLLHLLRDKLGLTGSKPGCEEGECGACMVFLDGRAVVSCLIPAARAHQANITTIEGLGENGQLDPVQISFIEHAAVQCGYCTPGFVMAAVKLLQEDPNPTREQIMAGLSGNLCRCTGYTKIIEAIEDVKHP
jgi:carbon-monoxide dehydrogenase medium subunit